MCNNAALLSKTMEQFEMPLTPTPEHHGLIANELVSVQPLSAPTMGFKDIYMKMTYNYPNYILHSDGTIVLKTKRNRKSNNKLIL